MSKQRCGCGREIHSMEESKKEILWEETNYNRDNHSVGYSELIFSDFLSSGVEVILKPGETLQLVRVKL